MSVRQHRIAAVSTLAAGVIVLLAWGHWMAIDSREVEAARDHLRGSWVAVAVQAGGNRRDTLADSPRRLEFDGKGVVFRGMIEGRDGRGTYAVDPSSRPGKIDLKLDAGWIMGVYDVQGDILALCVNVLALPDQLGVPTRPRPAQLHPADGRLLYVFRREGK